MRKLHHPQNQQHHHEAASRPRKGLFISLEGNIGSGKSTTLSLLPSSYNKIPEPVDRFTEFHGFNPLQLAYEDPTACAPICQLHIMDCIANCELGLDKNDVTISERSLYSTRCFILAQEQMGVSPAFTSKYLLQKMQEMLLPLPKPDYTISLLASPELCKKHVEARRRPGESEISLEYLQILDSVMSKVFSNEKNNVSIFLTDCMSKEDVACKVNNVVCQLLQEHEKMLR